LKKKKKKKPPKKKKKKKFQKEFKINLNPLKNSGQKDGQGGSLILKLKAKIQKLTELIFK